MAKKLTSMRATKTKATKTKATPARAKGTTTTLDEALRQLEALGDAGVRAQNAKSSTFGAGAGDNQFGVALGDIRNVAKTIKTNHALALSLWDTGNVDAQFLATHLIEPTKL